MQFNSFTDRMLELIDILMQILYMTALSDSYYISQLHWYYEATFQLQINQVIILLLNNFYNLYIEKTRALKT